jgi:hypothetical protein
MVNLKTAVAPGLTVGPVAGLVAIDGGVVSVSSEPGAAIFQRLTQYKLSALAPLA